MGHEQPISFPEDLQGAIANHLLSSFADLRDYNDLTDTEKRIFTPSQFEELEIFLDKIKNPGEFED
jgi:hypothetical protein